MQSSHTGHTGQQKSLYPKVRGLTFTQPWATLIAIGAKKIETRSWSTPYRGLVAIHAAKNFPKWARDLCEQEPFYSALRPGGQYTYPWAACGSIVAVVNLFDVGEITNNANAIVGSKVTYINNLSNKERAFGDYSPGRWAWFLKNIKPVTPVIPCKGSFKLWHVPREIVEQLHERGLLVI